MVSPVGTFAGLQRLFLLVSLCGKGAAMWSQIQPKKEEVMKPPSLGYCVAAACGVIFLDWLAKNTDHFDGDGGGDVFYS